MKIPKGFSLYNADDYLETEEDITAFLESCFEENDPELITHALAAVARARGMSKVAKKSGLSRDCLYKALSGKRIPRLDTFLSIVSALGMKVKLA